MGRGVVEMSQEVLLERLGWSDTTLVAGVYLSPSNHSVQLHVVSPLLPDIPEASRSPWVAEDRLLKPEQTHTQLQFEFGPPQEWPGRTAYSWG